MSAPAGVILYGGPASGKDTVTAELTRIDPRLRLYRRLKVGTGRTAGYRLGTSEDLERLERRGALLYANQRYDSTYAIDRTELDAMLADGAVPVIHVGQPEAVAALLDRAHDVRWTVVELWCPRDVAAERIDRRDTGDTAARLRAWDQTPHLRSPALRIDTSQMPVATAAVRITAAVATAWTMTVPVMHLVDSSGALDERATREHAAAASGSWIDFFLVNGSTTSGAEMSEHERQVVLDIWLDVVPAARLIGCVWTPADFAVTAERGVRPMAVMRVDDEAAAQRWLSDLPAGSTIYSHPLYGQTFGPDLARWAVTTGCLPTAGKLAKVTLSDLTEIASAAPEFAAWDGSSRHISQSLSAGAAGVVATPLAARLADLPPRDVLAVQHLVDEIQEVLDSLPDRSSRRDWLRNRAGQEL